MSYSVQNTKYKGYGVFSDKVFLEGEIIGEYISNNENGIGKQLNNGMFESEVLGRYCNHDNEPNTKLVKIDNQSIFLIANETINVGDEITTNYLEVENIIGVSYSTYYNKSFLNLKITNYGNVLDKDKII
jgi:hypothetical protein